jgi:hypothetical protein
MLLLKLSLICFAGLNAVWLHNRDGLTLIDTTSKIQAGLSILLWVGAIFAGRWIAYY